MNLREFLEESNSVEDLRDFCHNMDLTPKGRRKADLIVAVQDEVKRATSSKDDDFLAEFYGYFFLATTKDALVALCTSAGIPTTGKKLELAQRLAAHVLDGNTGVAKLPMSASDDAAETSSRGRNDGKKLEEDFARYLTDSMGFTSTRLRLQATGAAANRPYEVDVFAEKYNKLWDLVRYIGLGLFVLSVLAFIFPAQFSDVNRVAARGASMIDRSLSGFGVLMLGGLAVGMGYLGKIKNETCAWVECKDLKSGFKREHVHKFAGAVADVRAVKSSRYKPHVVYCVSGNKFDQDALNIAAEKGFVCYQREGAAFRKVS